MKYSIASVSFMNAVPLVHQLQSLGADKVDLQFALPSRLAALLEAGTADVALLPVVEIFRGRAAGIISRAGIACRGKVDSVKLFHQGPLEDVQRIYVDRGSRSSVALLTILFRRHFGRTPACTEIEPDPKTMPGPGEGTLVIGDRCFGFERRLQQSNPEQIAGWDLGQAWWELTELPFVFAAWGVSPHFLARASADDISSLGGLLDDSCRYGLEHLEELAEKQAALGRMGQNGAATREAVAYYFRTSLRYRLGDSEMAGMSRFHSHCIEEGLVPAGPMPLSL
jgi:chorismate dehydratase